MLKHDEDRRAHQAATQEHVQVAVACGLVSGVKGNLPTAITIQGAPTAAEECAVDRAQERTPEFNGCLRCPSILSETDYVVALVGDNGPVMSQGGGLSEVVVVNVTTADVTPPAFAVQPVASGAQLDRFDLTVSLDEPGTVHYAVAHAEMQAEFFPSYRLSFQQTSISSSQVLAQSGMMAARSVRPDGIIAAGTIDVPAGNTAVLQTVRAGCVGDTCSLANNVNASMITPATSYNVFLVAEDLAGNVQGFNGGAF